MVVLFSLKNKCMENTMAIDEMFEGEWLRILATNRGVETDGLSDEQVRMGCYEMEKSGDIIAALEFKYGARHYHWTDEQSIDAFVEQYSHLV
jgi:hypothetical protein